MPELKKLKKLPEDHPVFLDGARNYHDPDDDYRRCIVVGGVRGDGRGANRYKHLFLQILGADQDATEFLNRKQFEELVANARRIMGWDTDKLVMEGETLVHTEDAGMALIAEISGPETTFVRLQSYDVTKKHDLLKRFVGEHDPRREPLAPAKKLRVTVEVI